MPAAPYTVPSSVVVREIPEGASLRAFVDLAWTVNAGDPHWVPPLRMSLNAALRRGKHPFHEHAAVAYFIAERNHRPIGRIAAVVNRLHNEFHQERTGFFGLFECEDDRDAARALLDRAATWLRGRGMDRMRGPMNLSTNEEAASPGILIEGFETPPYFMTTHNPRYYQALLEESGAGLEKSKDLYAFLMDGTPPERLVRGVARAMEREGVSVRSLDLRRFRQEVDTVKEIYNAAWSQNWGFVPMTDREFEHLAKEFRPVVDADLCLIAEVRGEPVGFSLAIPNLNQALRHLPDGRLFPFGIFRFLWHQRKIEEARLMTLGIKPGFQNLGLGAAMYLRTWEVGLRKGYARAEGSWVLEDNLDMVQPLVRAGGRRYKTWRIYERRM